MKVSVVLALLALVCRAQTAPAPEPQKSRVLEFTDYYDEDDQHAANGKGLNATTTTTTTTTRRPPFVFPTRNQPSLPPKRTTTAIAGDIDELNGSHNDDSYYESNATYHYLQNIRRRFKQLWEEIKKFFRNMNMSEIYQMVQRYFNRKIHNDQD